VFAVPTNERRTKTARIIAQDPGVRVGDKMLMAEVDIPAEHLAPGPRGHRIYVIDYDTTTDQMYRPLDAIDADDPDPFPTMDFEQMLVDPTFHAWNVYSIAMRTLSRFEFALGRKVAWQQPGHQLKIFPHAFRDANAFYAPEAEALMFGYFQGRENTIYSCLAHDVIAHETTHAVLDGLRGRFVDPSSPDQAAFHEGFADVVALLEVLSVREVVEAILSQNWGDESETKSQHAVSERRLLSDKLINTDLFGLAVEMGSELSNNRGNALRRSVAMAPRTDWRDQPEWNESHRRGEILSAAMLRAFVNVWVSRITKRLSKIGGGNYDLGSVAEEGAEAASQLVTTAMRAIDYSPPIHLTFEDYLSALLTADFELRPNQDKYRFRDNLREAFRGFDILPAVDADPELGTWVREGDVFNYSRSRFEGMHTEVASIRPAMRIAPEDGVVIRETVVEIVQLMSVRADELNRDFGIPSPRGMAKDTEVTLRGGATLIFDEYGRLKYRIINALPSHRNDRKDGNPHVSRLHKKRLDHLWQSGYFAEAGRRTEPFRELHLNKALDDEIVPAEQW
jgi:hypothetical protein